MSGFSRREFLAAMAAGGAVVAGELWIPSTTLISIPHKMIRLDELIVDRQYGYNPTQDYSWVRFLWRTASGRLDRHLVRMQHRDVTTDRACEAVMVREVERVMRERLS